MTRAARDNGSTNRRVEAFEVRDPLVNASDPHAAHEIPTALPTERPARGNRHLAAIRSPERWRSRQREGVDATKASDRAAGTAPYGYRRTATGLLVADAHETAVLERMIDLRRNGGKRGEGATCQAIADELNSAGMLNRDRAPWRRGTVWERLIGADVLYRGPRRARAA